MATSGSKTVAIFNNNQLNLVFSWWFNKDDQSVVNNTTLIRWNLKLVSGSVGHVDSTASKKWSVTVNGKKYSGTNTVGIKDNTSKTLASGTTSVTHDSDGKKTFSYSFSQELSITKTSTGEWIGTKTGSGTGTLTTIPRKSTLSVSNGTLGTAQTLKVTRQSSSFTHTITAKCGSASTTICTKSTSTSIAFTPPTTWANQNKTGMSVSVTYTITTYNGSTNLGSNSYTKTYSIPSYSVVIAAVNGVVDGFNYSKYSGYVQSKTKAKFTISAATKYGATIKSITTTVDGKTYTGSEPTTGILSGSGTLPVKIVATDSRGKSTTINQTIKVLPYTSPKISSMSVIRSDADGNSSSSGAYLTVKFKTEVSSLDSKNSATYTLKYKKSTASSYTTKTLTDYKNMYSVTDGKYTFAADTGSSYNVELTVADDFSSAKKSNFGSSIKKLWSILRKGTGLAIGKIAEFANVFEVAWVTRIKENLNVGNKTGHLDGNTGVFISKEGYIQVQRDSSQGYHPYISFFHDDADYHSGMIRQNCETNHMEHNGASGYDFDSDVYVGSTNAWEDKKCGVRLSKSGGLQIQRTADSSPYIDFFFNGSETFDARIIHVLDDKWMKFKGADGYEFDKRILGETSMTFGTVNATTEQGINTLFKDGATHWALFRGTDGLTVSLGWLGNSSYASITQLRGQTCKYQNASGTTTLSDERLKKDFTDLDKWEKFFNAIEPCAFKMKAGTSGRFHIGFKAQQIEQALLDAGLTTQDFAGFIKMKYTPDSEDVEGSVIYKEAGINEGDDEYGLIYSEFIALNTYKIQKLQSEVDALKKEIEELKSVLSDQGGD